MRRTRQNLKYSPAPRRMQLNETRYWPVVKALLALLLVAALALAAVFVVKRYAHSPAPAEAEAPVAQPTARPTAAVTPGLSVPEALQSAVPETLRLSGAQSAWALEDPFVFDDQILFAAGEEAAQPTKLVRVDPATGLAEQLSVPCEHGAIRNPCEDGAFVVYLDAKPTGGGTVRALNKATGAVSDVCKVESGMPRLFLESPYLVFCERISAEAARLALWNLSTGETVAPALFTDPAYAASAPCIQEQTVYFADAGESGDGAGALCAIRLPGGDAAELSPGTFVHDPQASDGLIAWLSGSHGEDSDLYWLRDGNTACIARGVVSFGVAPGCIAYGRDATVFAVTPEDGRTYVLSGAGSNAQLAAVGGKLIVWRDLTDPGRPVYQYVRLG